MTLSDDQTKIRGGEQHRRDNLLMLSSGFQHWLSEADCSLAFTTYQRGRLFFVGLRQDGGLWAQERFFDQIQGLSANGDEIWVSTLYQLWNLKSALPEGTNSSENGADRLYTPRKSYVTGALDIHDIAVTAAGEPLFVNTRYSCLSHPDDTNSFKPVWKPFFITDLAPEDRCHLNGLAMDNGEPVYVTALARSDTIEGWRRNRTEGGIVMAVKENEIVSDRLSMPHSPRLYRDELWILNSGTGEFGKLDPADGRFTPVCFCSGYARGLAFAGDYAVIGLSLTRGSQTFQGLPLQGALDSHSQTASCGLIVVSLLTGKIVQWMQFEHTIEELYDVAVISGVRQPSAHGLRDQDTLAGFITVDGNAEAPGNTVEYKEAS